MRGRFKLRGFTLIELMIVVAIVAILAAIAYPSYQDSVRKSRRADARAVLLEAAQWMERLYTENLAVGYAGVTLPAALQEAPKEGGTKYYDITFANGNVTNDMTQNTFELRAAPKGAQSGDPCQTLTLRNTGARGVTNGATLTPDQCWR